MSGCHDKGKRCWCDKPVLLLGYDGMLGSDLQRVLAARFSETDGAKLVTRSKPELDVTDQAAVREALAELRPGVVINATGYTNVDGCEEHEAEALAVNGQGPGHLAVCCSEIGATLVHFSTDFVFDGASDRPYEPDDATGPLGAYGRTKLAGEDRIRDAGGEHLIIRTSWLFGVGGRNFVEAILARVIAGESLSVVDDQVGCPTFAADLAEATLRLLDAGATGTTHFANAGSCSWFEFANEIVSQFGGAAEVGAITSEKLGRPAPRPAFSVLSTDGYTKFTGETPPTWQDALRRYLKERSTAGDADATRSVGLAAGER